MDIAIWVEFENSSENRYFHVDDVITVEAPFPSENGKGNVLLDCSDEMISGRLAQSEIKKVERYWPRRVAYTYGIRVGARAIRRAENPLLKWLRAA